ncbi:MAG TPA: DmsC/YnfH family molybdoenzyme membrane anchor subunit [Bacteroidales bacterium]|nr:DmsC/YnfH family molybdoenzyme membrane anchor subunit [Bacteroidales bacterium]
MGNISLSLILFTLFIQASVGMVAINWLSLLFIPATLQHRSVSGKIILVSLCFALSGLALSFLHLGYPLNALYALNNIGSSPMSREILAAIIYIPLLFVYYLTTLRSVGSFVHRITEALVMISGSILILFMIKVYMLPSMPHTSTPYTPVAFIATSFILGPSLVFCIIDRQNRDLGSRLLIGIVVFTFFSYINLLVFGIKDYGIGKINVALVILYPLAMIAVLISIYRRFRNNFTPPGVISLGLVFFCEFLNRYLLFTNTYPSL